MKSEQHPFAHITNPEMTLVDTKSSEQERQNAHYKALQHCQLQTHCDFKGPVNFYEGPLGENISFYGFSPEDDLIYDTVVFKCTFI